MDARNPASDAPSLAAVLNHGTGDGDVKLTRLAHRLRGEGVRLAGAIQSNPVPPGRCKCDMILQDLATGQTCLISQNLGPEAKGCRLDVGALETMACLVEASVTPDVNLLIINKFGKRETEGGGFRGAIIAALDHGVPVLVGLNAENLDGWNRFTEGYGAVLDGTEALEAWLIAATPAAGRPATVVQPTAAAPALP